jgi:hypothetical protein
VRASLLALGLLAAGCSKSNDPPPPAPAVLATEATSASAASSSVAPNAAETWSGRYSASPGALYVPDGAEWAGVKFRGEDASVGLGEGTIVVKIDRDGKVSGALEGPLGPLRIAGQLAAKEFSAALVSGDPARGFAGTAVGAEDGDRIAGTMRLSLPTGNVLREASFALERKR